MSDANPFGMDPDDPERAGRRAVVEPELHVPLGKPVKLLLRSKDVLHNFAVAAVPRQDGHGAGHGHLHLVHADANGILRPAVRGALRHRRTSRCVASVVVDEPAAFQAWLDRQPTYAQVHARPVGDAVAGKAAFAVCAACHGANGEGNVAMNAPKLSGQGAWYLERQLKLFKQGARGTHEKDTFGKMMAPMAATLADDAAIANVVAYIAHPAGQRRRRRR